LPHIQNRITLDENNNIRVLDMQGKPSAMTIDELAIEFRNNPAFKPLIAANISSGGGASMGVISEAGCPAVADPGADVVAIAQRKKLKVVPLVGPSSIILSVMASGFNGQSFAFHGYLPIEPDERTKKLKTLEQRAYFESQTQLFIETPYRNHKMIEDILQNCRPQTKLCIAANITCEGEYIQTRTVKDWKGHVPELSKIPCIFLLYK
jgi:16S rRNA (cytidine1402-2'-O)-methyltransferase